MRYNTSINFDPRGRVARPTRVCTPHRSTHRVATVRSRSVCVMSAVNKLRLEVRRITNDQERFYVEEGELSTVGELRHMVSAHFELDERAPRSSLREAEEGGRSQTMARFSRDAASILKRTPTSWIAMWTSKRVVRRRRRPPPPLLSRRPPPRARSPHECTCGRTITLLRGRDAVRARWG